MEKSCQCSTCWASLPGPLIQTGNTFGEVSRAEPSEGYDFFFKSFTRFREEQRWVSPVGASIDFYVYDDVMSPACKDLLRLCMLL